MLIKNYATTFQQGLHHMLVQLSPDDAETITVEFQVENHSVRTYLSLLKKIIVLSILE